MRTDFLRINIYRKLTQKNLEKKKQAISLDFLKINCYPKKLIRKLEAFKDEEPAPYAEKLHPALWDVTG